MVYIYPRSAWTTTPEGFNVHLNAANVRGVVLHYPGDGNKVREGTSKAFSESLFRAYRSYHVNDRKWPDIGYNFGVDQAGRIWSLSGRKKAAHTASPRNPYANYYYVGILMLIGNNETPTEEMIRSVNSMIRQVNSWYGINEVLGHRQVYGSNTACPGDKVVALINKGIIGLNGPVSNKPTTPSSPTFEPGTKNAYAKRSYTDSEVEAIQRTLKAMGHYNRLIDQDYGSYTFAAVKRYQETQLWGNLVADGDWGPSTQSHFEWVKDLQEALNKWKSSYEPLVVDGDYRIYTQRRVVDVQRRNEGGAYKGVVDGKPEAMTCKMLGIRTYN